MYQRSFFQFAKGQLQNVQRRQVSMATTNAADQARAAAMRGGAGGAGGASADADIPSCEISDGVQKYVLIQLNGGARYLVRGNPAASYHADAANPTCRLLGEREIQYEVLGGGRIDYKKAQNEAHVYGFSYGFPWQGAYKHDITADVMREAIPGVTVTTSDEGY